MSRKKVKALIQRFGRTLSGEAAVASALLSHIHPNDVFVDIGAHKGVYGRLVKCYEDTAQVVSIEPHPACAAYLRNEGVPVLEYALGATQGEVTLYVGDIHNGHATASLAWKVGIFDDSTEQVSVPMERLDALVGAGVVPMPEVVKVDVEGAECGVIEGMTGVFASGNPRVLLIECHPRFVGGFGCEIKALEKRLSGLGYTEAHRSERVPEQHVIYVKGGSDE